MRNKISSGTQDLLVFIDELCRKEIIAYPIDYEIYHPSDRELAETFKCWFGSNKWAKDGDTFVQFGQDGTGSLFLLWFYPSLKVEPPIVFLGSEGESYLVAPTIEDFIRQLGSGKLFCDGDWIEPEEDEIDELDWQKLKLSVETKLGKNNLSPEEICNLAMKLHPHFTAWVKTRINY